MILRLERLLRRLNRRLATRNRQKRQTLGAHLNDNHQKSKTLREKLDNIGVAE